jgi:hypothetical protein
MAGNLRRGLRRPRSVDRRAVLTAAALTLAVPLAVPGIAAAVSPTIAVSGDSLIASDLPGDGQTTVRVTRPDAVTGQPVVIGTYSGPASSLFSVNTTTPTALNPSGDCWQKGALSEALTPDIRPGDTVTASQAQTVNSPATSMSAVVQPGDVANGSAGPIYGCSSIAPWARNAITSAPTTIGSGADLTVSGVAQALATGVSVSASDGKSTTAPVSVTPASDGSWTVTIPAALLVGLANTRLTVTPVFAVPDVSTGAKANIAGVAASVTKTDSAATASGSGAGSFGTGQSTASRKTSVRARVASVRAASTVSLASARKHGLTVSFVVPRHVRVVQMRLLTSGKSTYTATVSSHQARARQAISIPASLFKRLVAGKYSIAIKAGTSPTTLGAAVTHTLRLTP